MAGVDRPRRDSQRRPAALLQPPVPPPALQVHSGTNPTRLVARIGLPASQQYRYLVLDEGLQSTQPLRCVDCGVEFPSEQQAARRVAEYRINEAPTVSQVVIATGDRGIRAWSTVLSVFNADTQRWRVIRDGPVKDTIMSWYTGVCWARAGTFMQGTSSSQSLCLHCCASLLAWYAEGNKAPSAVRRQRPKAAVLPARLGSQPLEPEALQQAAPSTVAVPSGPPQLLEPDFAELASFLVRICALVCL